MPSRISRKFLHANIRWLTVFYFLIIFCQKFQLMQNKKSLLIKTIVTYKKFFYLKVLSRYFLRRPVLSIYLYYVHKLLENNVFNYIVALYISMLMTLTFLYPNLSFLVFLAKLLCINRHVSACYCSNLYLTTVVISSSTNW